MSARRDCECGGQWTFDYELLDGLWWATHRMSGSDNYQFTTDDLAAVDDKLLRAHSERVHQLIANRERVPA